MTVRDRRRAFCFQYVADLAHLRSETAQDHRLVVHAVYCALTEIANEERARENPTGFEATRRRIADRACVSPRSVDHATAELDRIGLIEVTRRGARRLPSIFVLIEPHEHDVQQHDVQQHDVQQPGAPGANGHEHDVQTSQEEHLQEQETPSPKDEFNDWIRHFRETTGIEVKGSTASRRLFASRREEWSLIDLKLATVGCQRDQWRRDNGQVLPEIVLKASNVEGFRLAGLRPRNDSAAHLAEMAMRPFLGESA